MFRRWRLRFPIEIPPTGCEGKAVEGLSVCYALFARSSPTMNICIPQTVHNRPISAVEVGRSPYLVCNAERILFTNSTNGFVLFHCLKTRAPCGIAPMKLPIILKNFSPPLGCSQWDVAPSTRLRSWKTIFKKSDNTLSQIFPVHHNIKERVSTSLFNIVTTKRKLIKGNRSHIEN